MKETRRRSYPTFRSSDGDVVGARTLLKCTTNDVPGDELLVDEKEAKVLKTQAERFRNFFVLFLFMAVLALALGNHQNTHHIHGQAVVIVASSWMGDAAADVGPSEEELQRIVDALDQGVRTHKKKPNMIMEIDPEALKLTKELQHATHKLLVKRYGRHAVFRVKVDLIFPNVIVEKDGLPENDYLLFELAPHDLIPCSVYNFLEIARTWKSGAFHRNANHVLQVRVQSGVTKSMPFQEYSPEYPHRKGTTGYAGRPSGPAWYVSIRDNTVNHGPGSQQKHNPHEADSIFGRVVRGMDDVVPRIHSVPQMGWLDKENEIQIPSMTILVPTMTELSQPTDGKTFDHWIEWKPQSLEEVMVSVK